MWQIINASLYTGTVTVKKYHGEARVVLLKLWWTVFGRVGPILAIKTSPGGGTIFAAKIGPP